MSRPIPVAPRSAARSMVVRSSAPVQVVPLRTITVASVPMATRTRNGQITIINNVNSTPVVTPQVFDVDDFPVPGLGFDFAHLAAINAGRRHVRTRGVSFAGAPFFGLPLFSDFSGVVPMQAAPPQVIIVQQPVPTPAEDDEAEATPRRGRRAYSAPASELPAGTEPTREAGEYVLVKRNGGLLFAVAFSVQNGQLNYITREGSERAVALASLDLDATQRMNEQRGTRIRLPA
ncbi:MAG TPA: hypothetical protein VEU31_09895 [Candidatus Acidoferrales bacterium]|nr:hypothetical protein [Candidatus Acidoferrales bacterium]